MKLARKVGSTSQILQIFIQDSSSTVGAGLTGLTNASAGLTAYFHRDTDTTATSISVVTMTSGTFTSGGFKEIDSTNMPGWYQFCPPNTALATGASSVGIHLKGATNMAPLPIEIDLDAQVDVTFWNGTVVATPATAGIPDVNAKNINNVSTTSVTTISANQGTTQPINFSGTGASAFVKSDTEQLNAQAVTAAAGVTFPTSVASPTNITAGTITTVTNLTNAPTSGDFTATMKTSIGTAVAASAVASVTGNVGGNVTGSVGSVTGLTNATIATAIWTDTTAGDFTTLTSPGKIIFAQLGGAFTSTSSSVYSVAALANAPTGGSAPTVSQIATAVWQDTTAGDFTVASSIGKSLYTTGATPGASGGLFIAGSNAATTVNITGNITGNLSGSVGSVTGAVGSVTGAVGSVTGNVGGNVGGSVASVTARVTANTDQLAGQTVTAAAGVTFPTSVASPTNITAGTITTVTNLTNAPTAGDFTATMKTSLNASTPASVTTVTGNVNGSVGSVFGAVGSVTGNVGGSIGGSVVGSVGSVTGNVGGNVTGSVSSVLTGGLIDLTSTTYSESSSVVAATATLKDAIVWLKTLSRNKITQTSTTETLLADNGTTTVSTSTDSDDGTTFTRGKWG